MSAIDPDKLRFTASAGANWLLTPTDCAMLADAIEIADSCARSDIECECRRVVRSDGRWYDLASADPESIGIEQSVPYLESRKLIERHPEHVEWIRFKNG